MRSLVIGIIGLVVLSATGPILIALAHAAVPVIVAAGVVYLLVRAISFFSTRW